MNSINAMVNKYLHKYWRLQAVVIILGLIALPLSLLNPYLTKLVIDNAYVNRDLKLFFILAVIGISIFVLNAIINFLSNYLSRLIDSNIHFDMIKDIFVHLQGLSVNFFNNKSTGEHMYRITHDVDRACDLICDTVPQAVKLFPRFLFILAIVFCLNWRFALFAALLVPIGLLHPYIFGRRLKEITYKIVEKSQDVFKGIQEVFSHMHLVKASGKENYEIRRLDEGMTESRDFDIESAKLLSIGSFSRSILSKVISGAIALYGGYQVIKGTMTLGSLTAVMIYLTQLGGLLSSIGRFYENVNIESVSCRRLAEILDARPEIQDRRDAVDYRILDGRLEFKDVSFEYKKGRPVFKGMNFEIEPASRIALVGPSGCGKTTLLNLILRLYDVNSGAVLIDGMDIRDIRLKSFKEQFGVALQEPFLWNDTVAHNILYGAIDKVKEEAINAARIAEAHDFITELPQGYDSIVGEMGCEISEGQKQRIAIARAVIKKPKMLILDEAMSSVDSKTEEWIMDNIKREFAESTIIVVSHRLSTAKKMDLVYFLEEAGRIDTGTHDELFMRNEKYRELFAAQIGMAQETGIILKRF